MNKDRNIDNDLVNRTMFSGSKLSFKSKKFWMIIFVPPVFLTLIIFIIYLISGNTNLTSNNLLLKFYLGCCFFILVIMLLVDWIQLIYRNFIKDSIKGKVISIVIIIGLAIKAIWEISRIK